MDPATNGLWAPGGISFFQSVFHFFLSSYSFFASSLLSPKSTPSPHHFIHCFFSVVMKYEAPLMKRHKKSSQCCCDQITLPKRGQCLRHLKGWLNWPCAQQMNCPLRTFVQDGYPFPLIIFNAGILFCNEAISTT